MHQMIFWFINQFKPSQTDEKKVLACLKADLYTMVEYHWTKFCIKKVSKCLKCNKYIELRGQKWSQCGSRSLRGQFEVYLRSIWGPFEILLSTYEVHLRYLYLKLMWIVYYWDSFSPAFDHCALCELNSSWSMGGRMQTSLGLLADQIFFIWFLFPYLFCCCSTLSQAWRKVWSSELCRRSINVKVLEWKTWLINWIVRAWLLVIFKIVKMIYCVLKVHQMWNI